MLGAPVITSPADGRVTLNYELDLGSDLRKDESSITWYRCTDEKGSNPLKVAVSRRNKAETTYTLSDGDVGFYLMATIRPKHSVSEAGPMQTVFARSLIAKEDVKFHVIDTDFQNFPADPQPKILPGTWTLDGYLAPEVGRNNTPRYQANPNSWNYGPGQSGSIGYHVLYQTARGARLFFTPTSGKYTDMTVRAKFAPNKSSGQGFGSATEQFLDVYIKYDLATNTGFGLRIQRLTTEEIDAIGYKGAGAVHGCAFFLAKYDKGVMTPLSKKVMSSAFQAECTVELTAKNGRLLASVTSSAETRSGDAFDYPKEVQFDVPIESNNYGGTGMLFTGTVGGECGARDGVAGVVGQVRGAKLPKKRLHAVLYVFELIASDEARLVFNELASGKAGAWLAADAEASLKRMQKKQKSWHFTLERRSAEPESSPCESPRLPPGRTSRDRLACA